MNNKRLLFLLTPIAFILFIAIDLSYARQNSNNLINRIERAIMADAIDSMHIDYIVPNLNNNPKACYIYLIQHKGDTLSDGTILKKNRRYRSLVGIENLCAKPKKGETPTGCNPYSCHVRILPSSPNKTSE